MIPRRVLAALTALQAQCGPAELSIRPTSHDGAALVIVRCQNCENRVLIGDHEPEFVATVIAVEAIEAVRQHLFATPTTIKRN